MINCPHCFGPVQDSTWQEHVVEENHSSYGQEVKEKEEGPGIP
jgi:hypothetical protein